MHNRTCAILIALLAHAPILLAQGAQEDHGRTPWISRFYSNFRETWECLMKDAPAVWRAHADAIARTGLSFSHGRPSRLEGFYREVTGSRAEAPLPPRERFEQSFIAYCAGHQDLSETARLFEAHNVIAEFHSRLEEAWRLEHAERIAVEHARKRFPFPHAGIDAGYKVGSVLRISTGYEVVIFLEASQTTRYVAERPTFFRDGRYGWNTRSWLREIRVTVSESTGQVIDSTAEPLRSTGE